MFVRLQTAISAVSQRAEGQLLEEQVTVVKQRMFRIRARMQTVSRTEGQYLVPLKIFIKNKASK
jgi:hypothetical protein